MSDFTDSNVTSSLDPHDSLVFLRGQEKVLQCVKEGHHTLLTRVFLSSKYPEHFGLFEVFVSVYFSTNR
jgi:hypothetical protein